MNEVEYERQLKEMADACGMVNAFPFVRVVARALAGKDRELRDLQDRMLRRAYP